MSDIRKVAPLFFLASFLLAQQPAPTEPPPLGLVSGVVIDVTTQEPLARVTVSIESSSDDLFTGKTDAEGKFAIENVNPGRYGVNLTLNQYVATDVRSSPSIRQDGVLAVGPGQVIDDLVFGLEPAGVITGRVLDEYGDPFEGLSVEALKFVYRNGSREPRVRGAGKTNDQGEYRIYGLQPADYYLRVNTSVIARATAGRVLPAEVAAGYVDVYYPNGYDASQARSLRVTGQAETTGIDFRDDSYSDLQRLWTGHRWQHRSAECGHPGLLVRPLTNGTPTPDVRANRADPGRRRAISDWECSCRQLPSGDDDHIC